MVILSLQLALLTNYAVAFDYLPDVQIANLTKSVLDLSVKDTARCAVEKLAEKVEIFKEVEPEPQTQPDLCLPSALVVTGCSIPYLPFPQKPSHYFFSLAVYYPPHHLRPLEN